MLLMSVFLKHLEETKMCALGRFHCCPGSCSADMCYRCRDQNHDLAWFMRYS